VGRTVVFLTKLERAELDSYDAVLVGLDELVTLASARLAT
jgi:hypothetical protein